MNRISPPLVATARAATAILIAITVLAAACTKPQPPKPSPGNLSGVNKWIYERMMSWYYWDEAVKRVPIPSASLPYNEFLSEMVVSASENGAQDNTENPPTRDGYFRNGERHYFSFISLVSGSATRAGTNKSLFGFSSRAVEVSPNRYNMFVSLVNPGSPAATAGLRRGTKIVQIGGQNITDAVFDNFAAAHGRNTGTLPTMTDSEGRTYDLTAAVIDETPILHHSVVTAPVSGKKVGYLVYNQFVGGPSGEETDRQYDNELITIFQGFKVAGVTEMVLDLRYNPGGDVTCCQLLTSLIGNVTTDQIFCQMLRRKDIANVNPGDPNPELMRFRRDGIDNGLKLNRLYVLATNSSASASEMVISALRGVLGNPASGADDPSVFHIGARTRGKNVGMDVVSRRIGRGSYELAVITFKIMNANGFCNYAGGFSPHLAVNEFQSIIENPDSGVIYDFGNPNERLLAAALAQIDGGTSAQAPFDTRWMDGDDEAMVSGMTFDPRTHNAIYYRDE